MNASIIQLSLLILAFVVFILAVVFAVEYWCNRPLIDNRKITAMRYLIAKGEHRIIELERETVMLRTEIAILRKLIKHTEPRHIPEDVK